MNAKYEVPGSDVRCVEINDESLKDSSFIVIDDINVVGKENKD